MCKEFERFDAFVYFAVSFGQSGDYVNAFVEVGFGVVYEFCATVVRLCHLLFDGSVHLLAQIRFYLFQPLFEQCDDFFQVLAHVSQREVVIASPPLELVTVISYAECQFTVDDKSLYGVLEIALVEVLPGTAFGIRHHDTGFRSLTDIPGRSEFITSEGILERMFYFLFAVIQEDV